MSADIAVIITAHKEGMLLYPTCQSAKMAIDKLLSTYDVQVTVSIYLDNADPFTQKVATDLCNAHDFEIFYGKNGDPGQARMDAINKSDADYIALLDGDDLWSDNWLKFCWDYLLEKTLSPEERFVLHPEYNLIFGAHNILVRQGDISSDFFDQEFLRYTNYWDALCFCPKDIFLNTPYQKNDVDGGFAHEDYLWMCETLSDGVSHLLIKDSVHFKRRRPGSVSQIAEDKKVKIRFNQLSSYGE